jgi:hypothetical protein
MLLLLLRTVSGGTPPQAPVLYPLAGMTQGLPLAGVAQAFPLAGLKQNFPLG